MTSIDITYRYCDDDTAIRPLPADSRAALLRLEQGNRSFAKLLDQDEKTGGIQQIIPVDLRDLGFAAGRSAEPKQRPFAAVLGCADARVPVDSFSMGDRTIFLWSALRVTASAAKCLEA